MSESTNILFRDFVCMMAAYLIVFISVENKNKVITSLEIKVSLHYRTPWLRQEMLANEREKKLKNISLTWAKFLLNAIFWKVFRRFLNSSKDILLFIYRRNEILYRENARPRERP